MDLFDRLKARISETDEQRNRREWAEEIQKKARTEAEYRDECRRLVHGTGVKQDDVQSDTNIAYDIKDLQSKLLTLNCDVSTELASLQCREENKSSALEHAPAVAEWVNAGLRSAEAAAAASS